LPDNAALRLAHDPLTRRDLRWQIDAGRVTLLRTSRRDTRRGGRTGWRRRGTTPDVLWQMRR
jgi:hypothetical protein